jgi:3-oxoacyl-[acyl-carrier-protein] synthase II
MNIRLGYYPPNEENYTFCPFDKKHRGTASGCGGGFMLLETLENAKNRNAKIYGEILGYGYNGHAKL